jgi:DDE domain
MRCASTILRWVVCYAVEFEKCWQAHERPVGDSWRCDETYLKVRGEWVYLYRAVDKQGKTVESYITNLITVGKSIDGVPVLDPRYLVADYLKQTSKIDERGSRRVLASATAALSEMLSRFNFDSDDAGRPECRVALNQRADKNRLLANTKLIGSPQPPFFFAEQDLERSRM